MPPSVRLPTPPSDARRPSWVLLDVRAYIANCENATTADDFTSSGQPIKVTFCMAEPPLVSYFCIDCPGLDPDEFAMEPLILATEDNLVLLRVAICPLSCIGSRRNHDHFIYEARRSERPLLRRLPNPHPFFFCDRAVGLMPRCTDDDHYLVAALHPKLIGGRGEYNLNLFHSKEWEWSSKELCVDLPETRSIAFGLIDKVITIRGESGSMGWVDLRRGILVCNVLDGNPMLRYIPLPKLMKPGDFLGSAEHVRDIVVSQGCVKFFEMQVSFRRRSLIDANYFSEGWTATTWSSLAKSWHWEEGPQIDASDILINNPRHSELLPNLQDNEATMPTLKSLQAGLPSLSLQNDDLVYLMTKVNLLDHRAWVVAVNIRNKTLQGVAEFGAERTSGLSFTYLQSRISKYLDIEYSTR